MEFGNYELLQRLRTGGMAEIFKAHPIGDPERVVALKRILPSYTDEADYVAMFRDEAALAARLEHPGIVAGYDIGRVDDADYLTLEYVHGLDLGIVLRRAREAGEAMPWPLAVGIARDLCGALHYAHELKDEGGQSLSIVHRDVSPQNVLLGADGHVKLIDFGIAKSSKQLMKTQAGLMKGKHGYLSPEQAQGEAAVDRRSDVFSLGICLYEMLTATRLFDGGSDFSALTKVREAKVAPLREHNAQLPEALERLLAKALARDPGERFQTAEQMGQALSALLEAEGEGEDASSPAALGAYLKQHFGELLEVDAPGAGAEGNDPVTGLLDAFAGLEPVSSVSSLAEPPGVPDERAEAAPDGATATALDEPPPELDPSERTQLIDASALEEVSDARDEGAKPPEAGQGSEAGPNAARGAARSVPPPPPGSPARAKAEAEARQEAAAASEEALRRDDKTPIVAYPSASGQPSEAASPTVDGSPGERSSGAESESEAEDSARFQSELEAAKQALSSPDSRPGTMPGLGVDWADEELSTQIYDPPEDEVVSAPPGEVAAVSAPPQGPVNAPQPAPVSAASTAPGAPSPFLPSPSAVFPDAAGAVAPASGPPQAAPLQAVGAQPAGAPVSDPAAVTAPGVAAPVVSVPPVGARPTRPPTMLWAALTVAVLVALVTGGLLIAREPAYGTVHLTTDPPTASVRIDGVPVHGSSSPYVLTEVSADRNHHIEVSHEGYDTWSTTLSLRPGRELKLPHVELRRGADAEPAGSTVTVGATATLERNQAPAAAEPTKQPSEPVAPEVAPKPAAAAAPEPPPSAPAQTVAKKPREEKTTESPVAAVPKRAALPRPTPATPPAPRVQRAPAAAAGGGGKGTLRINSRPWSSVHVDGRLIGNTPQMAIPLDAGRHNVTLVNPEFGLRKVLTVQIKAGEITTQIVQLQ
ncbi:MAG: protein kinase [Myxococcales bacterium]|nr:protein kinase [Myxococcales bacterium]